MFTEVDQTNSILAKNHNFFISLSLQPKALNLWLTDLTEIIVWNKKVVWETLDCKNIRDRKIETAVKMTKMEILMSEWFQNPTLLFNEFYNPLSGISYPLHYNELWIFSYFCFRSEFKVLLPDISEISTYLEAELGTYFLLLTTYYLLLTTSYLLLTSYYLLLATYYLLLTT